MPQNVRHLGWWDGGAYAGDPFGSTVIAGHVDSRTRASASSPGCSAPSVGEKITLRGDGHQAVYQITQ